MSADRVIPIAYFAKPCTITTTDNGSLHYPPRSIAVVPLPADRQKRMEWDRNPNMAFLDISSLFTTYDHKEHNRSRRILFTHLAGGIGDVLSFSAIAEFLRNKTVIVYGDPRHREVYRWFSNQDVMVRDFTDVVATEYTPANRITRYSTYARLRMEYAAIDAGPRNWYDAMFSRIGISMVPEGFRRPRLIRRSDTASVVKKRGSVLISHRSSCQIRSSRFEDFYWPVKNAMPGCAIYVHDIDLGAEDRTFIMETAPEVIILPRCSITQYLDNLYAPAMVVCTDTSAVHFREGTAKPCLAAFGAMTMESRTSGYQYTKSFNVSSDCPYQPCFVHQTRGNDFCPARKEGEMTAACQTGESFQNQLYDQLKNYRP